MQKNGSYGMAGECAAAKSAGNGGNRPATHTTDASPRPVVFEGAGLHEFWGRMQSEGNKSAFLSPRGLCAGRGSGKRPLRFPAKLYGKGFRKSILILDGVTD